MSDIELALRIKTDLERAIKDVQRLSGAVTGTGHAARGAKGPTDQLASATDKYAAGAAKAAKAQEGMDEGLKSLKSAAAAYLSVQTAINTVLRADAFRTIQGRVAQLGGDFRALYDTTQSVGVSLGTTVDLFQRLAMTQETIGASRAQVETVTRAVLELGRVGSVSQAEIASAAGQLGQAFSATKAQWEDFGIIADSMPILLREIEKGLGLMPGTIKQSVEAGMDMRDVFDAILARADSIHARFLQIPDNIQSSSQQLSTAWDALLAKADRMLGITKQITVGLRSWGNLLDRINPPAPDAPSQQSPKEALAAVTAQQLAAAERLAQMQLRLDAYVNPGNAEKRGQTPADAAFDARAAGLKLDIVNQLSLLSELARKEVDLRKTIAQAETPKTNPAANARAQVLAAERAASLPPGSLLALWGVESNYGTDTKQLGPKTKHGQAVGPFQILPATAQGLGIDINKADFADQAKAAAQYLSEQLKAFGDLTLAYAGYNAGPGAVQKYGNQVPPYRETQAYVAKAERIRQAYLAETGLPDEAAIKAAKEAATQATKAKADADREAGAAAEDAAEAISKIRGETAEQAEAVRQALDPVRKYIQVLQELQDLRDAGAITPAEYEGRVAQVAQDIAGDMTPLWEQAVKDSQQATDQMTEFATQAARNIQSAFAQFLFKPWEQSGREMLRSFVDMLHQMAAQALASMLLIQGLKLAGATQGGTNLASVMLGALVRHDGGPVRAGLGQTRQAPAFLWQFAPRLHDGGYLRPGEVPAILQTGEQVLSRAQVAAGMGQTQQPVRIVNTVDPELARDWVESAAGERVILNIIRRNRVAVRQHLE